LNIAKYSKTVQCGCGSVSVLLLLFFFNLLKISNVLPILVYYKLPPLIEATTAFVLMFNPAVYLNKTGD